MVDINLSKAVRSNLGSLQNTASLMSKTSDRLSTGNKVNSALDNPTNFFTASSLNSRAGDLNNLMDSMANGIKTIEAADNGLSAITKNLESMQSTLRQARQDKSFQTKSYDLSGLMGSTTLAGTEALSLSGGALTGTNAIALTKTGSVTQPASSGKVSVAAASFTNIDFNAAAPVPTAGKQAAGTFASLTLDSDDTITFDIAVDGAAATSVSIGLADVTAALGAGAAGAITSATEMASVLTTKGITGVTVANNGGVVEFTSATTGASSAVAVSSVVVSNGANTTGNGTLSGGLGAMATAVAGSPGTAGAAKTMSFTVAADGGAAQTMNFAIADAGSDGIMDINEFATAINSKSTGVTATVNATTGALDITSDTTGILSSVATSAVTVGGGTATTSGITAVAANATGATGAAATTASGNIAKSVDELVGEINSKKLANGTTDNPLYGKIRASNDNGKLRIENLSTTELNVVGATSNNVVTGGTGASNTASIDGNSRRADLAKEFNVLRDTLDKLADDASFNGINLLRGDNLKLTFNETGTSSIDIQTKDGQTINSDNLELATTLTAADLDSDSSIDNFLSDIKGAMDKVRSQSSAFGSNLSIVQNRQDFTKSMINTLETGAGNLTLADMNQEAANMMALQTRQSLASSTLSMANQADQGVLQLLR